MSASDIDFFIDTDPATGKETVIVSDTVHQRQHADFLARHIGEACLRRLDHPSPVWCCAALGVESALGVRCVLRVLWRVQASSRRLSATWRAPRLASCTEMLPVLLAETCKKTSGAAPGLSLAGRSPQQRKARTQATRKEVHVRSVLSS